MRGCAAGGDTGEESCGADVASGGSAIGPAGARTRKSDGMSWSAALGTRRMADALRLEDVEVGRAGEDLVVSGRLAPGGRR